MPLEFQRAVVAAVGEALPHSTIIESPQTPAWLNRPGLVECAGAWTTICAIYTDLTGLQLPEAMPPRERRRLDAVIVDPSGLRHVLEIDESQHFNVFRARTFERYPDSARLGFDREQWVQQCSAKARLEHGGFAKPRPPLFPGENGRHRQRAFRDALADLVPLEHGWGATVRFGAFELPHALRDGIDVHAMRSLLEVRELL